MAHPVSMGLALHFAGHVHELRRDWEAAGRLADELMALGAQRDFPHFRAWAVTQKGAALAAQGETRTGITDLRRGLAELRAARDEAWGPFYLGRLADALGKAGRTEEALTALDEAAAPVGRGQRAHESEVHRAAGELLLSIAGCRSEAEACLLRSLAVARAQCARSWELRAATSLARTWAERGEARKALDLLAPLYRWFAQGVGAPDLREAQDLLQQLS
jgi:tetratricopeptide (TPR) repeat protein